MAMRIPKRTAVNQLGPWWDPIESDGPVKVANWCHICCHKGHVACLAKDHHQVAQDGTVTPSCVCPLGPEHCTFHEWVILDGWPG